MAESTFSYTFLDLYRDVLSYQGQGRTSTDATALAKAKRRTNEAYRKFLCLDWNFLVPVKTFKVESGKDEYELPDDYGVMKTPFKLAPNASWRNPVETTAALLLQARSFCPQTGTPSVYALYPEYTKESGLRYKILFYPTPNVSLDYIYSYRVLPNILVEDADIPYCPANLSHVLRAFCLSEVEKFDQEGSNFTHTNELNNVLLPQAINENSIRSPNTVGSMNMGFYSFGNRHSLYGNTAKLYGDVFNI